MKYVQVFIWFHFVLYAISLAGALIRYSTKNYKTVKIGKDLLESKILVMGGMVIFTSFTLIVFYNY